MDKKKPKALATELAKGLKTEADLNAFSHMLTKLTVENETAPNIIIGRKTFAYSVNQ